MANAADSQPFFEQHARKVGMEQQLLERFITGGVRTVSMAAYRHSTGSTSHRQGGLHSMHESGAGQPHSCAIDGRQEESGKFGGHRGTAAGLSST